MGANTNAPIILSIFTFYIFIFIILGFVGSSFAASTSFGNPENPDAFTFLTSISYFFTGIGFSISSIPAWANILLFLPLGVTILYIVLSFFRGSS